MWAPSKTIGSWAMFTRREKRERTKMRAFAVRVRGVSDEALPQGGDASQPLRCGHQDKVCPVQDRFSVPRGWDRRFLGSSDVLDCRPGAKGSNSPSRRVDSTASQDQRLLSEREIGVAERIRHIRAVKIDVFDESKFWEAPLCQDLPGGNRAKKPLYAEDGQEVTCRRCWWAKANGVPVNHQAHRLKRNHPLRLVEEEK